MPALLLGTGAEPLLQPEIAEMPQKSRINARNLRRRRSAGMKRRRAKKVVLRGKLRFSAAVCTVEFTVTITVGTVPDAGTVTVEGEMVQVGW